MIDARLVAIVVVFGFALNAGLSLLQQQKTTQHSIPEGKVLRCEVVDKNT